MRQLLGLVLACSCLLDARAAVRPAPSESTSRPVSEIDVRPLLADPAGAAGTQERLTAMEEVLRAAQNPLEQASVELATANWLLAIPTASPATRWILGMPESGDLQRIHENASDAQLHLARARKLLGSGADDNKERRRELREAASTLESFAKLLSACSDNPTAAGYRQACEDAAIGMADVRESEKMPVASAAVMWQSLAWSAVGKQDRAMATLPDALSKPERLPYDFASRLLRCRVLAESGQPAAAIALTLRMGALCEDWFPQQDKAAVDARHRLVAVLQWKITKDWLSKLKATAPEAGQGVESTLSGVRELLATGEKARLIYHLDTALPIIMEIPSLRPAAKASRPVREPTRPAPDNSPRKAVSATSRPTSSRAPTQ